MTGLTGKSTCIVGLLWANITDTFAGALFTEMGSPEHAAPPGMFGMNGGKRKRAQHAAPTSFYKPIAMPQGALNSLDGLFEQLFTDLANRRCRIEFLRANIGAIHNGAATE